MVLAHYYLTLLPLNKMAHLILWRINNTAFRVVMKEAVKQGENGVEDCSYKTPEN
jgi:hypothetical protein